MTADLRRLAWRIAGLLVELLPTVDWADSLDDQIARILVTDDLGQIMAVASELRASGQLLRRSDVEQKAEIEGGLYAQWARRLELILAAVPDPAERAEAVLSILQASGGGVRSGWRQPDEGVLRVIEPARVTRGAQGDWAGPKPAGQDRLASRYLRGRCPGVVTVGRAFSVIVDIVESDSDTTARLLPFDVSANARDVLLVLHAPGLELLGDQQVTVTVPATGDSAPVKFDLRAGTEGPRCVSITAWLGGNYLGELSVSVTAGYDRAGRDLVLHSEIAAEHVDGAVSLVVRHDREMNAYRFEFRDDDYPHEVVSRLSFDPRHRVEGLVAGLDRLAAGHTRYSSEQAREYLANAGAQLWRELIPPELQGQFWDRINRIKQLTILADQDTVPWELLYPKDGAHDAGFLVQQFPVTRAVFGQRPASQLCLWPARFVLPEDSLSAAESEVDRLRLLLDPSQPREAVVADLSSLLELIRNGDFGLLHFACHNKFNPDDEAAITLGGAQFTPTFMTNAVIAKALARSAPTVFINACRSAGQAPTYNRLSGWADMFLEAGAGAFIGSLWAVSDGVAQEFAEELYGQLKCHATFGQALMAARAKAATHADDPTWLAYSAYGNPQAKISIP